MSEELRVVAIDDNPATLEVVVRILAPHGYVVRTAAGLAEAMALLAREPAGAVDRGLPGLGFAEFAAEICQHLLIAEPARTATSTATAPPTGPTPLEGE